MSDQLGTIDDTRSSATAGHSLASEAGAALCYAAFQEPLNGVTQLLDRIPGINLPDVHFMDAPAATAFGSQQWHSQMIGSAIGRLVPFIAAQSLAKCAFAKTSPASLLSKRSCIGLSLQEAAATGFIADSVFRPDAGGEQWLYQRLQSGSTGAVAFSAMTATSLGLAEAANTRSLQGARSLLRNPLINGALCGASGGLLTAELQSVLTHNRLTTEQELGQSLYAATLTGGLLGTANHLGTKAWETVTLHRAKASLRPDQRQAIDEAVTSLSAELSRDLVSPAELFRSRHDAQTFLNARKYLMREILDEGLTQPEVDRSAAAVGSIFHSNWKSWINQMKELGAQPMDAASSLPLRPSNQNRGLDDFLFENVKTERWEAKCYDHNDLVALQGNVAHNWLRVRPQDTALPLDELAFRLTEGMSRESFLTNKQQLLSTVIKGEHSVNANGQPVYQRGEVSALVRNKTRAGSVFFQCDGPKARISLVDVEPMYRRLGIGLELLDTVEKCLPAEVTLLTLEVAANNTAATRLYSKFGFLPDEGVVDNASILILSKKIAPRN